MQHGKDEVLREMMASLETKGRRAVVHGQTTLYYGSTGSPHHESAARAETTARQLKNCRTFLTSRKSKILAVLIPLRDERFVTMSKNGVWTMVHDA